jgi:hypothetical protein
VRRLQWCPFGPGPRTARVRGPKVDGRGVGGGRGGRGEELEMETRRSRRERRWWRRHSEGAQVYQRWRPAPAGSPGSEIAECIRSSSTSPPPGCTQPAARRRPLAESDARSVSYGVGALYTTSLWARLFVSGQLRPPASDTGTKGRRDVISPAIQRSTPGEHRRRSRAYPVAIRLSPSAMRGGGIGGRAAGGRKSVRRRGSATLEFTGMMGR